ncbi:MAG: type I-D CRISPR-associated helicase Cas3' [Bacillota bacterium]
MIEVEIAPVAFDQVEGVQWLPGLRPYGHQWEAYRLIAAALESRNTVCLFLVTPTGSGKTLAAYAYSIRTGEPVIGAYPTNELLADQARALEPLYRQSGTNSLLRVDSETLERWQADLEVKRHAETLEVLLRYEKILLTNPDILFYVAFGLYPSLPGLRERLWSLMGSYRLFVFDEFHLYSVKQQAEVAFLAGALEAINPALGRVMIFASATPALEMVGLLRDRLGLRVEVVEARPSEGAQARLAAHPVTLKIISADLDRWQGLTGLEEAFDQILAFRDEHPEARYVIIFDSVAAAVAAARCLREEFGAGQVGEVHGLSSQAMRGEALAQRITVGTSAIEVGVDFKGEFEKDCLIFEARTGSSFLQRFGRLGRHEKRLPIPNVALALVPGYVYQFLAGRLGPKAAVTRDELRVLVEEAYREPEQFRRYLGKHGSVPMAEASQLVAGMFQPDDRTRICERLGRVIQALTGDSWRVAMGKRRGRAEEGVLAPLLTFRGTGLEAAILDVRGDDPGCPAKRYDLMFLLRRGVFEEMDEKSYQAELDRLADIHLEWLNDLSRERRFARVIGSREDDLLGVYGFFRLKGLLDGARRVWFEIPEEELLGKRGQVAVFEGLEVCTDPPSPTRLLNRTLRRKRLVAWVTDAHPASIRFGRALPPLFAVYELRAIRSGGGLNPAPWSIAFNQNAFFLDSLWWNLRCSPDAIIV